MYYSGEGVPQNDNFAAALFVPAAEAGYPDAMAMLGAMCATSGLYRTAIRWSEEAAEKGSSIGMNTMGAIHHHFREFDKALNYYQKAVDAGDCYALQNIGGLYYNGDGVPQDGAEAQKWFDKATQCDESLKANTEKYMEKFREGLLPKEYIPDENIITNGSRDSDPILNAAAGLLAIVAIVGMTAPNMGDGPPQGEWKARFWCKTYFTNDAPPQKITECYNQSGGVWRRDQSIFDPCNGVNGWCDGYGLGPKAGFSR